MDSLADQWRSFLSTHHQSDLDDVSAEYPAQESLTVDLIELYRADEQLAQTIFTSPSHALETGRTVTRELTNAAGPVHVHLANNPQQCHLSTVSAHQLGELVTVRGVVKTIGNYHASVATAVYSCPACDASIHTTPVGVESHPPTRCPDCSWDGSFKFHPGKSEFVDTQHVTLGPLPDHQESAGPNATLDAYLPGDLIGTVSVDEHVGVTGVLRPREAPDSPLFALYLDAVYVRDEHNLSPPDEITTVLDSQWDAFVR